MVFKFTDAGPLQTNGEFTGPVDGSNIADYNHNVQLSSVDVSGQNTVQFMKYLVGNNILISEQNAISNFGHYTIDSYTLNGTAYTLNLTNLFGNGVLELRQVLRLCGIYFIFARCTNIRVFTQGAPAKVWNIQHNLGKFPSVSVINNNNVVINGEVTYIDNNNVQLNFSAGFTGKAYLN